jgi:uncharacterized protein YndB with AHSA1/START domain
MNTQPFVIERIFDAPIEKVWDALTKNVQMKKWYFQLPDFKAVVGFEFSFKGGPDEKNYYNHLCKVTEVIPGKKIAYSWRYEGYPGISFVSFALSAVGEKTKLRLTHTGLESFDQANPHFAEKNFELGWESILDNSLKAFVEK